MSASPFTWFELLQKRTDHFHAFTLGDRAALDDFPHNPYTGHDDDLAHYWQLGFLGFPFPARETE